MKRVMIVGISGAGKSTLCRKLAARLNAPAHHLDNIYHAPGWVPRDEADVQKDFDTIAQQDNWVVDGNYRRLSGALQALADQIVFLDFGRVFAIRQILQRWALHRLGIKKRPDLAHGFEEKMSWAFMTWVWNWRRDSRPKWLEVVRQHHAKSVTLTSRQEVEAWLASL